MLLGQLMPTLVVACVLAGFLLYVAELFQTWQMSPKWLVRGYPIARREFDLGERTFSPEAGEPVEFPVFVLLPVSGSMILFRSRRFHGRWFHNPLSCHGSLELRGGRGIFTARMPLVASTLLGTMAIALCVGGLSEIGKHPQGKLTVFVIDVGLIGVMCLLSVLHLISERRRADRILLKVLEYFQPLPPTDSRPT